MHRRGPHVAGANCRIVHIPFVWTDPIRIALLRLPTLYHGRVGGM